MASRIRGIHIPHFKNTAEQESVRMPAPKSVTLPMNMHIGAPSNPIVKVGDKVAVGQMIAEPGGFVSASVHASVSGTVAHVGEFTDSRGSVTTAITIESDGLMTKYDKLVAPAVSSYEELVQAVRDSGLIGLGGAGFPTGVKLSVKDLSQVEELLINGAECEPFITTDTLTMEDKADDIFLCLDTIKKYMKVPKIIIGIEENKPKAIAKMQELAASREGMSVSVLPSTFPQGGEKMLIFNLTGKVVKEGTIPIDVGSIVMNATSCAVLGNFIRTGMPLVERIITIDGSAVREPKNVIVPIGTSIGAIFDFAGGFKEDPYKVIIGGPMMGFAIDNLELPTLKNTGSLLAFNQKDGTRPKETPCLHCGKCVDNCPMSMNPPEIAAALDRNDMEDLKSLKPNLCIECGSCVFNCPARRDIVAKHRAAKGALRNYLNSLKEQSEKEGK